MKLWQLPPQLDDLRPSKAWQFELMRRKILDLFVSHDYQYIQPPIVEYTAALQISSPDRPLCGLNDQGQHDLSVRADITAQVARMDANLKNDRTMRYCYAGEVLYPLSEALNKPRNPYQIGAELFGESRIDADIELAALALECCDLLGITDLTLDVSNIDFVQSILLKLEPIQAQQVSQALKHRSYPEMLQLSQDFNCPILAQLLSLSGTDLATIAPFIDEQYLTPIQSIHGGLSKQFPSLQWHFDLGETHTSQMHNGLNWRLYSKQINIARGGRYDGIGERFGHARPATGFSFDLNQVSGLISP